LDLTGQMAGTAAHWAELGVTFDAIYSGFLGSAGQIGLIEDFYRQFRREGTLVLVDPVMGDHGKPYRTYTPELCGRMRDLAAQADVITPNLTEAALLLEEDYADLPRDEEGLRAWLERLSLDGRRSVVLTGVSLRPGAIGAGCFDRARAHPFCWPGEPAQFPGTGDLSPAWCWGDAQGSRWNTAQRAAEFVQRCATHTLALGTPVLEGSSSAAAGRADAEMESPAAVLRRQGIFIGRTGPGG
ncbi:MAG: bifunctional hydroxymethylpyrimidine kinase/phosphomethylpyrimidine kinase, partial [Flavonifractor plautii]